MIIEMEQGVSTAEIDDVVTAVRENGFEVQINKGEQRTVIGVFGANTGECETQIFEVLPGVEQVVRMQKPFKLASREFKKDSTIVNVGNVEIGNKKLTIMAGPCSVESRDQIYQCAFAAKEAGAQILRGGAFKPRTSPFAFQGLKEEGLKLLASAREKTGLLIVTEVVSPEDVVVVAEYADILQIGARNMQNYRLLEAAGNAKKPVLLKRGLSATVEEWLMAADYVLRCNRDPNVILCNRGIRTFDSCTRFTYDIGVIPIVRQLSHLPIITDPSHAAGNWRYVSDYARAAIAMGTDGLIIEIHPDPKRALSDGAQSLTFNDFSRLMKQLDWLAASVNRKI